MTVTAVIPNWNGGQRLGRVLADLTIQSQSVEKIIVVDNGSTDGSPDAAQSAGAELIRFPHNTGFAHAVNTGVQAARTPLVAILNNDLELPPHWLATLTAAFNDPAVSFATGKIYRAGTSSLIDGTYDLLARSACAWRCGHNRPDSPLFDQPVPIQLAPLTAAVFRTSVFTRVGFLDERFESYLEDIDFGIRCTLAGLEGRYIPSATASHWGSATLGPLHPQTIRRIARNQVFLAAKYLPARCLWPAVAGQLLWGGLAWKSGAFPDWLRGKAQGLRAWRSLRRDYAPSPILAHLRDWESGIRRIQSATGQDRYWSLYFALT
jgi:hypothetical protein